MADRPILFSGPMVRALLAGAKTQTRRVLKPQPPADLGLVGIYAPRLTAVFGYLTPDADYKVPLSYMPGDRLYVREAWRAARSLDRTPPRDIPRDADIEHAATARSYAEIGLKGKFRQGMHMPRWASRLTLIVTDVRVQRLQEISDRDAWAEGIKPPLEEMSLPDAAALCARYGTDHAGVASYAKLWDSLNAERGYGWAANPWVVAVSFTVHRGNIDQIAEAA